MAFLRKHRNQYWLVHNFREDGKVRQVRLYPCDLRKNLDHEITQAQHTVESLYAARIAPSWLEPVRQKLQNLKAQSQRQHEESQVYQLRHLMLTLVDILNAWQGDREEKNRLIWELIGQLQNTLADDKTDTNHSVPIGSQDNVVHTIKVATQTITLGDGFYLRENTIHHVCATTPAELPRNISHKPSPVVWVSLINGRDLWLECPDCHARWHDMSRLAPMTHLRVRHQRISRFDRFCQEHTVGDSCYIFMMYRSGHINRLHGTIQAIDYDTKKVQVATTQGRSHKPYWRNFDNVYFGHLEVRLTDEQRVRLESAGRGDITHLVRDWYAIPDTPDIRLSLQQLGIRY